MTETNGNGHELNAWEKLWVKPEPRPVDFVGVRPEQMVNSNGYAEAAVRGEVDNVLNAPLHTRNDTLNLAAFNLGTIIGRNDGLLSYEQAETALRWAAHTAGLEPVEIENTLRSGLPDGIAHPREIKALETSTVHEVSAEDILPEGTDGDLSAEPEQLELTSWWPLPIDEAAAQAVGAPDPTHLVRTDGQALMYSGKVNGLIGEAESGKSWVALLAAVQAVRRGEQVLILDFEDSPVSVKGRIIALGVTDEQQRRLVRYARPDETLSLAAANNLRQAMTELFAVIVVDGVNSAMDLMGLDLMGNGDATTFSRKLLRPLTATGACVITVDHVPKNPETRGKGGIGAQAKRAMIDGACLLVEVVEPFGKGQPGTLRLSVDKDRNGAVRGVSAGGKNPGTVKVVSIMDTVGIEIEPPPLVGTQEELPWRPTGLMTKVSELVEELGELTQNTIIKSTMGNEHQLREAIDRLVKEGCLSRRPGPRNSILYTSVRPFRDDSSGDLGHLGQPRPDLGLAEAERPRPTTPIPLGGGRGQAVAEPNKNGASSAKVAKPAGNGNICDECGTWISDSETEEFDGHCRRCAKELDR